MRPKTLAAAANAALQGIEGSTGLDVMQSNWVLKNHAYNTIVTDAFEAGKNAVSATGPSVYSITADPNPVPSAWDPKRKTWGQIDGAVVWLVITKRNGTAGGTPVATRRSYYLDVRPLATDLSTTCAYEVPVAGKGPFDGLWVFLSPTRTLLKSVRVLPPHAADQCDRVVLTVRDPQTTLVPIPGPLVPTDGVIRLSLRFIGDPPSVRAITLLAEDGPAVRAVARPRRKSGPPAMPPPLARSVSRIVGFAECAARTASQGELNSAWQ